MCTLLKVPEINVLKKNYTRSVISPPRSQRFLLLRKLRIGACAHITSRFPNKFVGEAGNLKYKKEKCNKFEIII